jgi:AhpD family alkylhydroperoxidase
MKYFRKRTYHSFDQFKSDMRFMVRNWRRIRRLGKGQGNQISLTFLERLVMTVTAVNGCRYCSQFHARHALTTGLSQNEVISILQGDLSQHPDEEAVGILYARHWAESGSNPDPRFRLKVIETYGRDKTQAIELVLRAISVANLVGNTVDYLLYRVLPSRISHLMIQG